MNLRSRAPLHHPGIQLAPLVDVLLLLLIFFLLTWNAARNENELDVKVPKASAAREKSAPIGDVVVNVKADGNVVVNRRTLTGPELTDLLKGLVQLNAEQAVVIRGDEAGAYKNIIGVLNICTQAGITNSGSQRAPFWPSTRPRFGVPNRCSLPSPVPSRLTNSTHFPRGLRQINRAKPLRRKPKPLIAVRSITQTLCSTASSTISPSRNTKNISTIIRAVPVARTLIFHWVNVFEIFIAPPMRGPAFRKS